MAGSRPPISGGCLRSNGSLGLHFISEGKSFACCHFICNLYIYTVLYCSRVRLCATPQTAAHQAPPSPGFSRQEHWSGLPFPSPMHESEKWKWSRSVVFDSSWPHGLQPTRLLRPWDFPGKSTGVGCHCFLLIFIYIYIYMSIKSKLIPYY